MIPKVLMEHLKPEVVQAYLNCTGTKFDYTELNQYFKDVNYDVVAERMLESCLETSKFYDFIISSASNDDVKFKLCANLDLEHTWFKFELPLLLCALYTRTPHTFTRPEEVELLFYYMDKKSFTICPEAKNFEFLLSFALLQRWPSLLSKTIKTITNDSGKEYKLQTVGPNMFCYMFYKYPNAFQRGSTMKMLLDYTGFENWHDINLMVLNFLKDRHTMLSGMTHYFEYLYYYNKNVGVTSLFEQCLAMDDKRLFRKLITIMRQYFNLYLLRGWIPFRSRVSTSWLEGSRYFYRIHATRSRKQQLFAGDKKYPVTVLRAKHLESYRRFTQRFQFKAVLQILDTRPETNDILRELKKRRLRYNTPFSKVWEFALSKHVTYLTDYDMRKMYAEHMYEDETLLLKFRVLPPGVKQIIYDCLGDLCYINGVYKSSVPMCMFLRFASLSY